MKKKKCKCGKTFVITSSDFQNVYVKEKPKGEYKIVKIAYCPYCKEQIIRTESKK